MRLSAKLRMGMDNRPDFSASILDSYDRISLERQRICMYEALEQSLLQNSDLRL